MRWLSSESASGSSRVHAVSTRRRSDKLLRRRIARSDVDAVLDDNEVIELYEHDDRVRYVLLGHAAGRPLHVVVAEDDIVGVTVVLSVYDPDEAHGWDPRTGFRERMEGRDGE